MYNGSEKMAGHAYAPGYEPGSLAAFLHRMAESDLLMLIVPTLALCVLAALLAPGRTVSLRRRRKCRDKAEERFLSAEELSARLREQGIIR